MAEMTAAVEAQEIDVALDDSLEEVETEKYLIFSSGGVYYGVNTDYVKELLTQWETSITRLPMLPAHIRGVINLRGGIVPMIDFRLLMGQMPEEKFCTIVLDMEGVQIGVLVDEVDQTMDIEKSRILPVPYQSGMEAQKMVTGMYSLPGRNKTLMVLDCTMLLNEHQ